MATPHQGRKRIWRFRLNDTTTLEVSAAGGPTEKQVRRRARWSLILGTLIAALALCAVAFAGVTTDKTIYNFGETVYITGDGMSANEDVSVDVNYPDGLLAQHHVVQTNDQGNFSDSFNLAEGMPSGDYSVVATGLSSGALFTTTFDPPAVTTTTINLPSSVTYGDSFTFSGTVTSTSTVNTGSVDVLQDRSASHDCTSPVVGASSIIYSQSITSGSYSSGAFPPAVQTFPIAISLPDGNFYVSPSPSVGTYGFLANYGGGTPTFAASTSGCKLLTVTKANISTAASPSATSNTYGQSIIVDYTVGSTKGVTGNTATGSAAVGQTGGPVGGTLSCSAASTAVSAAQTTGTGFSFVVDGSTNTSNRFTCKPDHATNGTDFTYKVNFADTDGNYNDSSSSPDSALTVNTAPTATSANPSDTSINLGQSIDVDWTVKSAYGISGNTATGTVVTDQVSGPAGQLGCIPASRSVSAAQSNADGTGASDAGFSQSGSGGSASTGFTCTPASAGTYTYKVQFSDTDGDYENSESATLTLVVSAGYVFTGFYPPVDPDNIAKAGQGISLKWNLYSGSVSLANEVIDPVIGSGHYSLSSTKISCSLTGTGDALPAADDAGSSGLRYDYYATPTTTAYGQNVFVWKTLKDWANTCRRFNVTYGGTTLSADFKFIK